MFKAFFEKVTRWMLPAVLILFILEVLTFPLVLSFTYSDRSQASSHVLTYTPGKLVWDSGTGIRPDGTAVLDLFDHIYGTVPGADVVSADGDDVVAPGTEGYSIVRLKNDGTGTISFKAVLYRIRTDETLPVEAALSGTGLTDISAYPMPEGVGESQVLRAVSGTVTRGGIRDLDISWLWQFYVDGAQDIADTDFGNRLEPDEVTVGLYIVVEDGNSYITPDIPQTGDDTPVVSYLVLMAVSLLMMILLLIERYREQQRKKWSEGDISCGF